MGEALLMNVVENFLSKREITPRTSVLEFSLDESVESFCKTEKRARQKLDGNENDSCAFYQTLRE